MPIPLVNDVSDLQPGDVFTYLVSKPRVCVIWRAEDGIVYYHSYQLGDTKPVAEATFISTIEDRSIAKLHKRAILNPSFWIQKEVADA